MEREDYADGMDELADKEFRGATRDFVILLLGSIVVIWTIAVLVNRGLLR
jgi:hypothetical protein